MTKNGHALLSHNHRDSKSNQRYRIFSPRLLLAVILLGVFVMGGHKGSAGGQVVPLITLQSSENILEDMTFISALTPAASIKDKQIYALRRDAPKITVYDVDHKRSKDILSFGQATRALAIGSQGRIYLAGNAEVRVMDPTGRSLVSFPIPNPTSIAVSANGDIAVSSIDSGKLVHIYNQAGSRLRSFGELKQFDTHPAQNNFLNQGKVVVSPSGDFYYVSIFAPTPTVQKFSSEGKLLLEFAIEGNAVDLQVEFANKFLRTRTAETVGGFNVLTSAAIDPVTGHLWIGLNGSSTSGVAYEYDSNGVKLAEYAFLLNPPLTTRGVITDLKDISVNTPWIHVLTSPGQVYRFNMNDKVVRQNQERKTEGSTPQARLR